MVNFEKRKAIKKAIKWGINAGIIQIGAIGTFYLLDHILDRGTETF